MNIPVYNCIINEDPEDETGVYAISFVDCPANEVDFVALSKQNRVHLNRDIHKQILTGVVLKPDQMIYRRSEEMGEYYIKFSAGQIEKIAHKMMRSGIALHNTTHQHQTPLSGNYLTELWIVEDPKQDKATALGFADLPKGTLMCSYKIDDKAYWDSEVMTGNVKGFSLEGFFNQQTELSISKKLSNQKYVKMNNKKSKPSLLERLTGLLLSIEDVQKKDATASGETFVVFVLADGKEVYIDQDGFATQNEEQMPAGEHKLGNGNILVIDDQGQFVETKEASATTAKPKDAQGEQTLRRRNRQRMAEVKPEFIEALKSKLVEMQATIEELTKSLEEASASASAAKNEAEALRRRLPSTRPAVPKASAQQSVKDMTTAERMAVALSESLYRKRK